MTVSFRYPDDGTLDLSNGAASRLLTLIGYKVTEETSGEMEITAAEEGIGKARRELWIQMQGFQTKSVKNKLTAEDAKTLLELGLTLDKLWDLQDVVTALFRAGKGKLVWF